MTKTSIPAAAITLPVGYYVVRLDATVENTNENPEQVTCDATLDSQVWVEGQQTVAQLATIGDVSYIHAVAPLSLRGGCDYTYLTSDVTADVHVTATAVGTLHGANVFSVG